MPIINYPKCWRGRGDCDPFQAIDATSVDPATLTEEQVYNLDYPVDGFICCGCVKEEARQLPQDAYRLCFKTANGVDEMSDNDEQDLTHILAVVSHALAVIATQRVNGGMISVPTEQGKIASVAQPVEARP